MPRFYCAAPLVRDTELDLPAGAARHVQVLRLQPGDAITLFDECGLLLVAEEPAVFAELNAHHWPALLWQRRRQ